VPLEKEGDSEGMLRSDLAFCHGAADKANLMATAVSARVDIYKLSAPIVSEENEVESIKPVQRIFKFKDVATSVALRGDGNLILCGEKTGRVQLVELQNKFVLKTYEEHSGQVNNLEFKDNKEFVVAANDTGIKVFNILE
jgi:hypothetical protein